jgi:hypothetical protein
VTFLVRGGNAASQRRDALFRAKWDSIGLTVNFTVHHESLWIPPCTFL